MSCTHVQRGTMNHPESKIQAEIVKALQERKILFCSIPNEAAGKGAAIRMAQLKTLGLKSGAPDLLVFMPGGKLICFEVKSDVGRQSPAQMDFEAKLKERGFLYYIARSVQDVLDKIESI